MQICKLASGALRFQRGAKLGKSNWVELKKQTQPCAGLPGGARPAGHEADREADRGDDQAGEQEARREGGRNRQGTSRTDVSPCLVILVLCSTFRSALLSALIIRN